MLQVGDKVMWDDPYMHSKGTGTISHISTTLTPADMYKSAKKHYTYTVRTEAGKYYFNIREECIEGMDSTVLDWLEQI